MLLFRTGFFFVWRGLFVFNGFFFFRKKKMGLVFFSKGLVLFRVYGDSFCCYHRVFSNAVVFSKDWYFVSEDFFKVRFFQLGLSFFHGFGVLFCLVLSCLVLSCLVLSCLVLSCLVLSCLVLSCLVLSCLVLSCLVLFLQVVWIFSQGFFLVYCSKCCLLFCFLHATHFFFFASFFFFCKGVCFCFLPVVCFCSQGVLFCFGLFCFDLFCFFFQFFTRGFVCVFCQRFFCAIGSWFFFCEVICFLHWVFFCFLALQVVFLQEFLLISTSVVFPRSFSCFCVFVASFYFCSRVFFLLQGFLFFCIFLRWTLCFCKGLLFFCKGFFFL